MATEGSDFLRNSESGSAEISLYAGPLGAGGASVDYTLVSTTYVEGSPSFTQKIHFQEGMPSEKGFNGITNEVLLGMLIDRLECFQAGPFPCIENVIALGHAKAALVTLQQRTAFRKRRGVEGKPEK